MDRCEYADRRIDRPCVPKCDAPHPAPDKADLIVAAVENNLRGRRGIRQEWDDVDAETEDEIRLTLGDLVRAELAKS